MTTTRKTENSGENSRTENSATPTAKPLPSVPTDTTDTTKSKTVKPTTAKLKTVKSSSDSSLSSDRLKLMKRLMHVGFHLGHPARKWNPKMAPYIYGKLDGNHIIDITQSLSQIRNVAKFLRKASSDGKTFLFVGTKRQINQVVKDAAIACDALYVTQRWLGGMLTNMETMLPALRRLELLHLTEKSGMSQSTARSAKEHARELRKRERLEKYFGGLVKMRNIPDVVIIVGQPDEHNAVLECKKLGISTVTLLDSDCDPTLTDYFVSANDDSPGAVKIVLDAFVQAICDGQNKKPRRSATSKSLQVKDASGQKLKALPKALPKAVSKADKSMAPLILVRPKRPPTVEEAPSTPSTKTPVTKKPKTSAVNTPVVPSSTKIMSTTPSKQPKAMEDAFKAAGLTGKSFSGGEAKPSNKTKSNKTKKG